MCTPLQACSYITIIFLCKNVHDMQIFKLPPTLPNPGYASDTYSCHWVCLEQVPLPVY